MDTSGEMTLRAGTARNLTREEIHGWIQQKTLSTTVPSVAYLAFVCLLGLIGNSMVLFVYSRKFTRTPTRVFILAIAGFDLITNLLVIPGEMYSLLHWWHAGSDLFCKILMYLGAHAFILGALLLVAVAFARLSKSLKGVKKQLNLRDARQLCIVIVIASFVFSVPYAVVNGKRKRPNLPEGVSGYQCGVDDAYPPVVSTAIAAFLILLFVVCVVTIMSLYSLVWCRMWRRRGVYDVGVDGSKACPQDGKNLGYEPKGGRVPIVTSRSRSYIKKKPASDKDEKASAPGPAQNKVSAGRQVQDNAIEYLEENKPEDEGAHPCEARLIRSPTGDKVTVNLSMVRELTIKLKAVQKQAEERLAKGVEPAEDVVEGSSENNNEITGKADKTAHKEASEPDDASKTDHEEAEASKNDHDPIKNNNEDETEPKEIQDGSDLTDGHSQPMSQIDHPKLSTDQTTDDVPKKVSISDLEHASQTAVNPCTSETGECSDTRLVTKNVVEIEKAVESCEREKAELAKEEESSSYNPSDFAKAMQWVEITYCQRSDQRASDADDDISGVDPASLMKKGSFMSSRKVSRDNSFLRKHRKLRDALTDTLTRARKSKKDRDDRNGSCPDISDKQNDRISEDVNDIDSMNVNDTSTDSEVTPRHRKEAGLHPTDNGDVPCNVKPGIPVGEDDTRESDTSSRDIRRGLGATTWMLLVVSLIYVISSLPYMALNFIRSQSPDAFRSVEETRETVYNVFIRAHFLNSAAKPLVYAICNAKFRNECWRLHKHC